MRDALPNAFLFGLTGTPINRFDRNTFYAFGAEEDDKGYMSRYGFEESIRDGATLNLHFEPRLLELHIDKAAIDATFKEMTGGLSDLDKDNLGKTAAKMAVLVKTPERIRRVCEDIVQHFRDKVEPNGFKGQIVTFDRESCLLYKRELDKLLIGVSKTAQEATISCSIHGKSKPIGGKLGIESYDYINYTKKGTELEKIEGFVSSYNSNTYKGRIFIPEVSRPIPFLLGDTAQNIRVVSKITNSLHLNAQDRMRRGSGLKCDVYK